MKKTALSVLFLLCSVSSLFADQILSGRASEGKSASVCDPVDYNYEVGLAAGLCSGMGLSFRHWDDRDGFEVTGFPYFNSEDRTLFYEFGYLRMRKLYSNDSSIFYLWGGGLVILTDGGVGICASAGPGLEVYYENFGVNLLLGFCAMTGYPNESLYYMTSLTAEVSAYYRFNL